MRYSVSSLVVFTILTIILAFIALGPFFFFLLTVDIFFWIYFFFVRKAVKSLEVRSTVFPSRVFTDDEVKCETKIKNMSNVPLLIEINDLSSDGYLVFGNKEMSGLLENEIMTLSYTMKFRTRGEHSFNDIKIHVNGFLKLFSIDRNVSLERKILVFPQILPIEKMNMQLIDPVSGRKTDFKILEDSSRIVGVREYYNEPFQKIHWKASAHTGELMVKEYEYTGSSRVIMYVDYNLPEGIYARNVWAHIRKDYEEYASMAASGFVKYFYDRGIPVNLKVMADKVYTVKDKDYIPYLEVLARARGIDDPSESLLLQNNITSDIFSMSRTSTIIIISIYLTDEIIPKLLMARSRVAQLNVFVIPYGFRMPYEKKYDTYSVLPSEIKRLKDRSAVLIENNVMIHVLLDNESFDEAIKRYEKTMDTF
ncbi:DUF58 domain-containing protein [Athalassotoga saccharophila]|uniref:DUF58 domain-containing protein n=1 Tax=Athalassotoga saccharophila TaxID=1441386 RepID=UPI00137AC5FD|nr:DUF58 domain-containing protein [Athalassotoga saccharophila]BBJ27142.1 hypothetical protein ATHSA_0009 [Athalassotoga saccharophila]